LLLLLLEEEEEEEEARLSKAGQVRVGRASGAVASALTWCWHRAPDDVWPAARGSHMDRRTPSSDRCGGRAGGWPAAGL
jgi:hypothetical protein